MNTMKVDLFCCFFKNKSRVGFDSKILSRQCKEIQVEGLERVLPPIGSLTEKDCFGG